MSAENLVARVKLLSRARGWSQARLAQEIGYNPGHVWPVMSFHRTPGPKMVAAFLAIEARLKRELADVLGGAGHEQAK